MAAPPLRLPVTETSPPSNRRNTSQPQSYLTSPSPAKTSTIHFDNNNTTPQPQQSSSKQQMMTPQSKQTTVILGKSPQANVANNNATPSYSESLSPASRQQQEPPKSIRPPPREPRQLNEYFKQKAAEENDPHREEKMKLKERLHTYFNHYSPHLYHEVDNLVKRFWDHQNDLWLKLIKKYGPEPKEMPKGMDTKSRLIRFFRKYEPTLEVEIDKVMNSYGGFDETMWKALTTKYGPELSLEEAEGLAGKYKKPMDLLSRLQRFFKANDMAKLAKAGDMAKQYEKKEADLRSMLKLIYGAELEVDPDAADREIREAKECEEAAKRENAVQEQETKKWLVAFLQQHNPKRMSEVDSLLSHFKGRQEALKDSVVALFGTGAIDYNTPRLRLIRIYQKYNPMKIEEVDTLLERFNGRSGELFDMLKDKYNYEKEPEYRPDEYALRWIEQQENQLPTKMGEKTKKRLQLFFLTYDPKLANNVDHVMSLFRGKEDEMWKTLIDKYGPEPEFVDIEEEKRKKEQTERAEREKIAAETAARERAAARFKVRVTRMYRRYNPRKVAEVDSVIAKYSGREEELMTMLVNKYGEEEYFNEQELDAEIDGPTMDPLLRERIIRMYHRYNPSKLQELETVILPKYVGKEEELIAGLCAKYGPEPAWGEGNSVRDRVTRFYIKYKPEKMEQIDAVLEKYSGKEKDLFKMLTDKYGEEPPYEDASAAQREREEELRRERETAEAAAKQKRQVSFVTADDKPKEQQVSASSSLDVKTRLRRIYLKYEPEKATEAQMQKVLAKFEGRESELWDQLGYKYGPEPDPNEKLDGDIVSPQSPTKPTSTSQQQQQLSKTSPFDVKTRLKRIYLKYEPAKATDEQLDKVLKKFAGKEDELFDQMNYKYGPEPLPEENLGDAPSFSSPSAKKQPSMDYRTRLMRYYLKYEPDKANDAQLDKILTKFAGREEEIFEQLAIKHGPEPDPNEPLGNSSSPAPPPPAAAKKASYSGEPITTRVMRFYLKYEPAKATDAQIDKVVQKYAGEEEKLIEMLELKYGAEPTAAEVRNLQGGSANGLAPPPPAPSTTTSSQDPNFIRLMDFYKKNEPAKANADAVNMALTKYEGRLDQLWINLEAKYGVSAGSSEPTPKPAIGGFKENPHRQRLSKIYEKYDPSKLQNIDAILEKYQDNMEVLYEALEMKYPGCMDIAAGGGANINTSAVTADDSRIRGGGNAPLGDSPRDRLIRFYLKYEPVKANDEAQIEKVLGKYQGRFEELWEQLTMKYGPEPQVPTEAGERPKVKFSQS